jgi:glycosyltransferase involved in cell wall biosynthesis
MQMFTMIPVRVSIRCALANRSEDGTLSPFIKSLSIMTQPRTSVSAFIVCCNEEKQIRRCLASLTWCDEVVVVDSGSTDRTLDICREFNTVIHHRDWTGYIDQKRHALGLCQSDWVLNLDADEEVSPELRSAIESILQRDKRGEGVADGYALSRVVHYLNRWWRKGGWYPEYRLRFCRRSKVSWGGEEPHEKALIAGSVDRLSEELRHFTYEDLSYHVRRANTLSSNAAAALHGKQRNVSAHQIVFRPLVRFFKFYIVKRGFREGLAGFIVAWIEATQVLLKYAKLWEARQAKDERGENR